jgi:hypothetical protein
MRQICEARIVLELCPDLELLTKALGEDALHDTFRAFSDHTCSSRSRRGVTMVLNHAR